MKVNKTLADFGAYGSALEKIGIDPMDHITDEEAVVLNQIVDDAANTEEEAQAYIDFHIAQFRAIVEKLVKGGSDVESV
jgi:hypothetical protein